MSDMSSWKRCGFDGGGGEARRAREGARRALSYVSSAVCERARIGR